MSAVFRWVICAALLVLSASLHAADAPRSIEFGFKPVNIDSAYQRRATWQDTLQSSIEKLRNDHPSFLLGRCKLDDKWFRNGPHEWPAGMETPDNDFGVPLARVDLRAETPDGRRIWVLKGPVKTGQPYDLKLPTRSSVFQCRQFNADFAGTMDMVLSSEVPLTLWHNGKKLHELTPNQTNLWHPVRLTLTIRKGPNELMIRFDNPDRSETTRFYIQFNNLASTWHRTVEQLQQKATRDFKSPCDVFQQGVDFDAKVWLAPLPAGDAKTVSRELAGRYAKVFADRHYRDILATAAREVQNADDLWAVRSACYGLRLLSTLEDRVNFDALRRAITDSERRQGREGRGDAVGFQERVDAIEQQWKTLLESSLGIRAVSDFSPATVMSTKRMTDDIFDKVTSLVGQWTTLQRDVLLSNPAIDFDKLLFVKRAGGLGLPANWLGNCSMKGNLDDELVVMNVRDPAGRLTPAFKPQRKTLVDLDLNWDGKRLLYSTADSETRRWRICEIVLDPETGKLVKGPHPVTPDMGEGAQNYDGCYLPDDRVIFSSTAVRQGVPCIGGSAPVANLYLLSQDRMKVRQLCFDQDHNWNPAVMNDGRVLYTRWEYMDIPHYYSRLLFQMNPDGTGQNSYYGSNSIWPNSIFFARPIPGDPSSVVAIISGHHGVARMGELVIFDPGKGRKEAEGVVQRVPGYGEKVEAVISDALVNGSWPKFLHPYPLDGKTFIVSCEPTPGSLWGIYLVDTFDNMLLLKELDGHVLVEPIALRSTPRPPVISDVVDLGREDATVLITDIYAGPGLKDVPRGTVDRLRVFTLHYGYNKVGGWSSVAVEGSWEPKRIIGTVPVEKDGSVFFRVPANTPIVLHPIDRQGRALQIMRSWFTAMPGESVSCVGCHEDQNAAPPGAMPLAARRGPQDLTPWYGLTRGIDFLREIQPILNAKCVKCHDGSQEYKDLPDFADTKLGKDRSVMSSFPRSYNQLHPFVRRPGPESDYAVPEPLEYHASTSELVQILEKGHHGVKLTAEDWDRIVTWIDMNVQAYGTWSQQPKYDQAIVDTERKLRVELRKQYASVHEDGEVARGTEDDTANVVLSRSGAKHVPLTPPDPRPAVEPDSGMNVPAKVDGWPFKATRPAGRETVGLSDGIALDLVRIPAGSFIMGSDDGYLDERPRRVVRIEKPFHMAATEISNAMYNLFDPHHDTRYIDVHGVLKGGIGIAVNHPSQPVSRVTWEEALAFCAWLSNKTGDAYTLPTEEQWEWACRAGTDTPHFFGEPGADYSMYANLADTSMKGFADYNRDFLPRDQKISDHNRVTASVNSYLPNPWGLHNMLGNVSEWTLSDYGKCGSGIDRKVIRGGSWRDRPNKARASWRWGYYKFQPVFDVGFRVVRVAGGGRVSNVKIDGAGDLVDWQVVFEQ